MNRTLKSLLAVLLVVLFLIGISVVPFPNDTDYSASVSQNRISDNVR